MGSSISETLSSTEPEITRDCRNLYAEYRDEVRYPLGHEKACKTRFPRCTHSFNADEAGQQDHEFDNRRYSKRVTNVYVCGMRAWAVLVHANIMTLKTLGGPPSHEVRPTEPAKREQ